MDYSRELLFSLARQAPLDVLTFAASGVEPPAHPAISWHAVAYTRPSPVFSLLSSLPDVAFRFDSQVYLDRAMELARRCRGVVVDFLSMAWIIAPLKAALRAEGQDIPFVMVTHNHEGALRRQAASAQSFPKNLVLGYDAMKAARLECQANRAADGITTIIHEDAEAFASLCPTPSLVLLPGYSGHRVEWRQIGPDTRRSATIIGNRTAFHKIAVLEHALAALHDSGADRAVQIEIAGAGRIERLAQRYDRCRFHGFVNDLPAHLAQVRLGLIPDDLGGGFKMRVLTLAMHRVPILGLNAAMAGTTLEPGVHYHGVDSLAEMAAVLPTLIDDFPALNTLQEAAYQHCLHQFRWDERGTRLAAFLASLAKPEKALAEPA